MAFVPGYEGGARPYGTWRGVEYWVSQPWIGRKGSERTDFGGVLVRRLNGIGLQTAVGHALDLGFNQPIEQGWESIGYPAGPQFHDQLWHCMSGVYGTDDYQPLRPGPSPFGIGCNTTGGESGGPVLSENGTVGGVNTYTIKGQAEIIYATYLGSEANALYSKIQWR